MKWCGTTKRWLSALVMVCTLEAAQAARPVVVDELPGLPGQPASYWHAVRGEQEAAQAVRMAARNEAANVFFTGKPYDADLEGYLFQFRTYRPDVARWTSADPSGFPDGANASAFLAVPTYQLDVAGLFVEGSYSISQRRLVLYAHNLGANIDISGLASGNNDWDSRYQKGVGPLPDGNFGLYSRERGAETYGGHRAFILDPLDGTQFNDRWDSGPGQGRGEFRIHVTGLTEGCITMNSTALDVLWAFLEQEMEMQYASIDARPTATITNSSRSFENEWFYGTIGIIE